MKTCHHQPEFFKLRVPVGFLPLVPAEDLVDLAEHQTDGYADLSRMAFRASATVIISVIGSTGEAMNPHLS